MSHAISRMYDSQERVNAVVDELRLNEHHRFNDVFVVSRSGGSQAGSGTADASSEQLMSALMGAMILKSQARIYVEGIQRGGTLVTVHAPFGSALTATAILDSHGPIDSGYVEPTEALYQWDDAAPCSSVFRMPVLLPDSATFSRFWNVKPLLAGGKTTSSSFGLAEISKSVRTYVPTIPMTLLSKNGTILSSMLSLPVLRAGRARPARR